MKFYFLTLFSSFAKTPSQKKIKLNCSLSKFISEHLRFQGVLCTYIHIYIYIYIKLGIFAKKEPEHKKKFLAATEREKVSNLLLF